MKTGLVLLFALTLSCFGQSANRDTLGAQTNGPCSPAVTGNNNKFTITCQNIPDKLRSQVIELLNRMAKNESDAETILSKVDGCMAGVNQLREQQKPWQLTENQKAMLTAILRGLSSGNAKVSIDMLPSDRNAALMGADISNVLKPLGWVDNNLTYNLNLNPQLVGIHVVVKNPNFPQAIELLQAFSQVGIVAEGNVDTTGNFVSDDNGILIAIGAKPITSPTIAGN